MKNLTIIITMAGAGSRFKKAGYNVPKYMIKAKDKTLFDWSMNSLIGYRGHVSKYIFVVQKNENAKSFILEHCKINFIPNPLIIELDNITDGQATTCMKAIPFCDANNPILIYNIDTYIEPMELKIEDISGDGFIPCFKAEGDHWSFVKLNEKGSTIEIREKVRISENCSLGAYYFSSASLYQETYNAFFNTYANRNIEKYIAPMYNLLIENEKIVKILLINSSKVHVLGTPEELKLFIEKVNP